VYDASFPDGGAPRRAARIMDMLQGRVPVLSQPGVVNGLFEVAYSAHIGGVQLQLYSGAKTMAADDNVLATQLFRDAGLPIARCAPKISYCPGYDPGPWNGTPKLPPGTALGAPYPGDPSPSVIPPAPHVTESVPPSFAWNAGCGSRGGPGYRLPSGKCASWRDAAWR
jgi:hypothetical protein